MFHKPHIEAMFDRLQDPAPDFTVTRENGEREGYNACCIDLFDKLNKIGIMANYLFMTYLFGEDNHSVHHVRCLKCREYHGPFDINRYNGQRDPARAMEMLKMDFRTFVNACGLTK